MEPIGKDSFVGGSVPPLKYCNPLYTPLAIKGRLQVFFIVTVALVLYTLAKVVLVVLVILKGVLNWHDEGSMTELGNTG